MKLMMASAAILALITTAAVAQTTTTSPPASGQTSAAATAQPPAGIKFVEQETSNQWLATDLIGASVYGPNDKSIGEIDDLLTSEDGKISAALIGVGGFLGIGEKKVAISFEAIKKGRDQNGKVHLTVAATEDQLKNAPTFKYLKDTRTSTTSGTSNRPAASNSTTSTTTTTTTTTPPASSTQVASTQANVVTLSAEDQTKFKQWVTQEKKASVAVPSGTTVAVGSVLPADVTLYEIPSSAGITSITKYRYTVIDNRTVLVDPSDRKIVYVVS